MKTPPSAGKAFGSWGRLNGSRAVPARHPPRRRAPGRRSSSFRNERLRRRQGGGEALRVRGKAFREPGRTPADVIRPDAHSGVHFKRGASARGRAEDPSYARPRAFFLGGTGFFRLAADTSHPALYKTRFAISVFSRGFRPVCGTRRRLSGRAPGLLSAAVWPPAADAVHLTSGDGGVLSPSRPAPPRGRVTPALRNASRRRSLSRRKTAQFQRLRLRPSICLQAHHPLSRNPRRRPPWPSDPPRRPALRRHSREDGASRLHKPQGHILEPEK